MVMGLNVIRGKVKGMLSGGINLPYVIWDEVSIKKINIDLKSALEKQAWFLSNRVRKSAVTPHGNNPRSGSRLCPTYPHLRGSHRDYWHFPWNQTVLTAAGCLAFLALKHQVQGDPPVSAASQMPPTSSKPPSCWWASQRASGCCRVLESEGLGKGLWDSTSACGEGWSFHCKGKEDTGSGWRTELQGRVVMEKERLQCGESSLHLNDQVCEVCPL